MYNTTQQTYALYAGLLNNRRIIGKPERHDYTNPETIHLEIDQIIDFSQSNSKSKTLSLLYFTYNINKKSKIKKKCFYKFSFIITFLYYDSKLCPSILHDSRRCKKNLGTRQDESTPIF